LGWKGAGTQFDVLPLVLSAPSEPPQFFEIPKELVLEVAITHPQLVVYIYETLLFCVDCFQRNFWPFT